MIPPNNIWWLSWSPLRVFIFQANLSGPPSDYPSKVFSNLPFWVLSYDLIPPFWVSQKSSDPPLNSPAQPPPPSPPPSPAINNERSVRWIIKSRLSLILRVNVVLNRTVIVHSDSLSSAEASLFYGEAFVLWGGWGESKRERAGHDGLCIFFDYWYFDGDTQREPLRRRETVTDVFSTCVVVIFRVCLLIWLVNYVATNTINWRYTTHFDSDDDYRTGCQNASHCQQQCNSPVTTRFTRTIKQWLLRANLLQGRLDIMQIRANSILGSL